MVKLKDVAMAAGVNPSTASRALKNNPEINKTTRERIIKIAEDMGYFEHREKPVIVESKVVGIIIPEVINVFADLVDKLQLELRKRGFCAMIGITNYDADLEDMYLEQFAELSVSGVLYGCWENESELRLIKYYDKYRIPIVQLIKGSNMFDLVGIDYTWEAELAIEFLVEKGYKSLGIIGEKHSMIRLDNIIKQLKDYDIRLSGKHIKIGTDRFEKGGYIRMKELLREDNRPTAVIAAYDDMAVGAMKAIYDAGLRIPENIAIIGFDNAVFSKYQYQPLTTVKTPVEEWGKIAVQTLMEEIYKTKMRVKQHILLKPTMSVRNTT